MNILVKKKYGHKILWCGYSEVPALLMTLTRGEEVLIILRRSATRTFVRKRKKVKVGV